MIEIKAIIKYLKMSPDKLRQAARVLENMSVVKAFDQLKFLEKRAALPILESLKSVTANAVNNLKLDRNNLKIKTIEVSEGARLKRWRAVSRGTAHQYKKRTSNIKIILEEVVSGPKN